MSQEPLLKDNPNRYTLFPLEWHDIWKAYENHKKAFWTAQEIDYTSDQNDWESLNDDERYFIEHILAFFAGSDGIVLENLITNFCSDVQVPEARCFYGFQIAIENIHSETYSLLIDQYIKDKNEKDEKEEMEAEAESPKENKQEGAANSEGSTVNEIPDGRRVVRRRSSTGS